MRRAMKFPGRRTSKHFFPVSERGHIPFERAVEVPPIYVVGIDQLLVDIEARVDEALLVQLGIPKGQSVLLGEAYWET
jgi:inosine kinase